LGDEHEMPKKKVFLGSKDVAHILDMSPDDVIFLVRRGKLRATKQGRFWRYRLADVTAYKKRMEKQP
jgi:hypothetical protein